MSLDFAWDKLDETLASRLVDALNRHLSTVSRPSFIGPVEVTSFEFGTTCPEVEVVDMRDIYRDFLEDDEDDEEAAPHNLAGSRPRNASGTTANTAGTFGSGKLTASHAFGHQAGGEEDEYEWVSRRSTHRAMAQEAPAYHHLPPHLRYGRTQSSDFLTSLPGMHTPRDIWSSSGVGGMSRNGIWGVASASAGGGMSSATAAATSVPDLRTLDAKLSSARATARPGLSPLQGLGVGIGTGLGSAPTYAASTHTTSSLANTTAPIPSPHPGQIPPADEAAAGASQDTPSDDPKPPNLQLHLHILYNSDLRLTITTSLLINYPSPMFMALPIKLSVTGLIFNGEVVVAFEGQKRRVHLCILDDLDPYGPAADQSRARMVRENEGGTPPSGEDEDGDGDEGEDDVPAARAAKPLPVGQRLLPSIFIESEIGQADKHMLKNVSRVERFIQDVIRKTIEDELVFPNFHTLILGE